MTILGNGHPSFEDLAHVEEHCVNKFPDRHALRRQI